MGQKLANFHTVCCMEMNFLYLLLLRKNFVKLTFFSLFVKSLLWWLPSVKRCFTKILSKWRETHVPQFLHCMVHLNDFFREINDFFRFSGSSTSCTTPPTTSWSGPRPWSRTPSLSLMLPHSGNGKCYKPEGRGFESGNSFFKKVPFFSWNQRFHEIFWNVTHDDCS